ncbi:hypothetical protein CPB84DRAFT_1803564 [Gymnopilus junonius]|uniref:F-box domain-containing protein n=1 Tax=Gymnopilus junonius TaxID=109634 RepID=A0A9P5N819_GYMJU|nr:hypothetical protein CPB84DRAFT_1803564 [Gymnopilus junonius]
MPSIVLSNELLDLIIYNIDADSLEGRKSLLACSQANRALHIMSQRRGFRDVVLPYSSLRDKDSNLVLVEDTKQIGARFLDLITRSPHIASYVRSLEINVTSRRAGPQPPLITSYAYAFSLHNIVSRLHNLKQFVAGPDLEIHPKWESIEKNTRELFRRIVPLVQVLELYLFYNFPISAFSGCYNLRELRTPSFTWDLQGGTTPPSDKKVRLRALDLLTYGVPNPKELISWFASPLSPFDISHLHDLKLSDPYYSAPHINGLLGCCANTLERLYLPIQLMSIRYQPKEEPTPDIPDFSSLLKLHHVTFTASIRAHFREMSINKVDTAGISYIASI